jgi:hypothetical protein
MQAVGAIAALAGALAVVRPSIPDLIAAHRLAAAKYQAIAAMLLNGDLEHLAGVAECMRAGEIECDFALAMLRAPAASRDDLRLKFEYIRETSFLDECGPDEIDALISSFF